MNRKRLLRFVLGILLLPWFQTVMAQEAILLKGKIIDAESNVPLAGATIVSGDNVSVVANGQGFFELKTAKKNQITVSMVGYVTQVAKLGDGENVIALKASKSELDEAIVVGYGTQKKAKITGAVSSMKADEIALIPTSNLSNVLAGRMSGTYVRSGTGTPGISSEFRIRAASSWNGSATPVFVIDGIVSNQASFDGLDPNEVAEITVLKDAASAAVYGSRSSNGVVLVTTKTGKSGKAVINFSSTFSTEKTGSLPEYMDMEKGLGYSKSVLGGISQEEIDWVLKNNPGGMNYYNAAYQDPTNMRHALSISGGSDKVTYYIGGSYFSEGGFLPNVKYNKFNLRSNVQVKLTKDLTVGLNVGSNNGTRQRFNFTYDYGSADLNNLWGKLLYWDVFSPAYIDGKPVNPGWLGNPVEMMKNGGYWKNNLMQLDALATIEYRVPAVPGLAIKGSFSKNLDNSFTKTFAKKQLLYNFKRSGPNNLEYTNEVTGSQMSGDPGTEYIGNEYAKMNSYQLNGQISYDKKFGEHTISATAVYEWDPLESTCRHASLSIL